MLRVYLRYMDEYVLHDYARPRFMRLNIEHPELERVLRDPNWRVVAVQVADESASGQERGEGNVIEFSPLPKARPTPGPWRIGDRRANGEVLIHADRQIVASVIQGHQDYTAEANARLIAAAVNAVHRLAEHLGRNPLEVAEELDLVTAHGVGLVEEGEPDA